MSDLFWTESEYDEVPFNAPAEESSLKAEEVPEEAPVKEEEVSAEELSAEAETASVKAEEPAAEAEEASAEPAESSAERRSRRVIAVSDSEIEHQMDLAELFALTEKSFKKKEEEKSGNQTLDYYNRNAENYYQNTVGTDMTVQYRFFLKYLSAGARILDLGCGSGRDTKYFRDNGYNVTAVDGSAEMCRKAEAYTGINVRQMDFLDLSDRELYAGIWASASLLHIAKKDMIRMLAKLRTALTKEGVLYVSFKEGSFEGVRNGRYYTDLTEGELFNLVNRVGGMKIVAAKRFTEQRDGEEVHWISAIIKKW